MANRKRKDGTVRIVDQLNNLFPEEAAWRYNIEAKPPFWLGAHSTAVHANKDGTYASSDGKVLVLREGVLTVVPADSHTGTATDLG